MSEELKKNVDWNEMDLNPGSKGFSLKSPIESLSFPGPSGSKASFKMPLGPRAIENRK
jgi:hypothetical protein